MAKVIEMDALRRLRKDEDGWSIECWCYDDWYFDGRPRTDEVIAILLAELEELEKEAEENARYLLLGRTVASLLPAALALDLGDLELK